MTKEEKTKSLVNMFLTTPRQVKNEIDSIKYFILLVKIYSKNYNVVSCKEDEHSDVISRLLFEILDDFFKDAEIESFDFASILSDVDFFKKYAPGSDDVPPTKLKKTFEALCEAHETNVSCFNISKGLKDLEELSGEKQSDLEHYKLCTGLATGYISSVIDAALHYMEKFSNASEQLHLLTDGNLTLDYIGIVKK
jgi:hypothetical protein